MAGDTDDGRVEQSRPAAARRPPDLTDLTPELVTSRKSKRKRRPTNPAAIFSAGPPGIYGSIDAEAAHREKPYIEMMELCEQTYQRLRRLRLA